MSFVPQEKVGFALPQVITAANTTGQADAVSAQPVSHSARVGGPLAQAAVMTLGQVSSQVLAGSSSLLVCYPQWKSITAMAVNNMADDLRSNLLSVITFFLQAQARRCL